MKRNRPMAVAAYTMAASMGLVPLLDAVLSVWPPRIGDIAWRYGTVGIVADSLMLPLLGVAFGVGLALAFRHRTLLRALAGVTGVGVVITIAVLSLFLLDAFQMRARIADDVKLAYDMATAVEVAKMMVIIVFGFAVSWGGVSAARRRTPRSRVHGPGTLVMGGGGAARAPSGQ